MDPKTEILKLLGADEFSPLIDPSIIDWKGICSQEDAERILAELVESGEVVERDGRFGLRGLVEAHENEYEALKRDVYRKAEARGLWPTWRPDRGWRLVDGGRQIVVYGNMRDLKEWLDASGHSTEAIGSRA